MYICHHSGDFYHQSTYPWGCWTASFDPLSPQAKPAKSVGKTSKSVGKNSKSAGKTSKSADKTSTCLASTTSSQPPSLSSDPTALCSTLGSSSCDQTPLAANLMSPVSALVPASVRDSASSAQSQDNSGNIFTAQMNNLAVPTNISTPQDDLSRALETTTSATATKSSTSLPASDQTPAVASNRATCPRVTSKTASTSNDTQTQAPAKELVKRLHRKYRS